jgi:hypothetical protein
VYQVTIMEVELESQGFGSSACWLVCSYCFGYMVGYILFVMARLTVRLPLVGRLRIHRVCNRWAMGLENGRFRWHSCHVWNSCHVCCRRVGVAVAAGPAQAESAKCFPSYSYELTDLFLTWPGIHKIRSLRVISGSFG